MVFVDRRLWIGQAAGAKGQYPLLRPTPPWYTHPIAMLNYCIFLILWSILVLLSVAWVLAARLDKAFQNAPPQPPIASAQLTDPAPAGHVLSYAPPPVKQSSLLKRPWLAGLGALLYALLLLSTPSFLPTLAWSTWGMLRPLGITALVVSTLALLSACVIVGCGLRKTGDIPAAVSWPKRRLLTLSLCGIPILILTLIILDLGTKARLQKLRDEMDAQSRSLHIAVPAGTINAADLYRQVLPTVATVPDWPSRYSPGYTPPTAPPALSPELERAVSVLRDAASLPVVDWGIAPESYTAAVNLPPQFRRSADLLRVHAAGEARSGRLDAAISDIHAAQGLARHAGQGYMLVEALIAMVIDAVSCAMVEDVLPLIPDEKHLDQLTLLQDSWRQDLRCRMFRGEQAACVRTMVDRYRGAAIGPAPAVAPRGGNRLTWTRVFLAESDAGGTRALFDEITAIAAQSPQQIIPASRLFNRQIDRRAQSAGPLTSTILPSVSRAAETSVRCQSLAQLCNIAIAARRYHLRTGHLPATLDDLLSAKLLNEIPTDPFSGKPILLKILKDQAVIYSVGPDGRDDGGDYVTGKDTTFRLGTKPLWEIDAEAAKADQAAEQIQDP